MSARARVCVRVHVCVCGGGEGCMRACVSACVCTCVPMCMCISHCCMYGLERTRASAHFYVKQ